MRAVVVQDHGGPEVLRVMDLPDPTPGPDEVVVAVAAVGVNFIDTHHRSGRYPVSLPFVPGQEAAGTVVRVGSDVAAPVVGQRVGWVNVPGCYAEQVCVPADRVVPLPGAVSERTAAALLLQGLTAHYLATDLCRLSPADWVLVHAAAGGLGQLLVQLLAHRGVRVIGTVSADWKMEVARTAGAERVLRHDASDLLTQIREVTDGVGVAAVFDGIGAPTFDTGLAALRPRGMFVLHGQAGGRVEPVDLERLNAGGSLFVTRPNLTHFVATRQELRSRASAVFELLGAGGLSTRVTGEWGLAEAAGAHAELESRRSVGKLILRCEQRMSS